MLNWKKALYNKRKVILSKRSNLRPYGARRFLEELREWILPFVLLISCLIGIRAPPAQELRYPIHMHFPVRLASSAMLSGLADVIGKAESTATRNFVLSSKTSTKAINFGKKHDHHVMCARLVFAGRSLQQKL